MKPLLSICLLAFFGIYAAHGQQSGALVFYSDVPSTVFYNNDIIEVSDHEIIFDMAAEHPIGGLWSRMMVNFMEELDTFESLSASRFLIKANFLTKEIEAIDLGYTNYSTRTNARLVKGGAGFYYIDPEVPFQDSMDFAGESKVFNEAKGSKVIVAEFDFNLQLKSFTDYKASPHSLSPADDEAVAIKDGVMFTENEDGTRKAFDLSGPNMKVSTVSGNKSFLSLIKDADRWGARQSRTSHNQSGTFDHGFFLSANTESLLNQYRYYSMNHLHDDLSVDTLLRFESNGIFTSIASSWDPDFKWLTGTFVGSLFFNYFEVSKGYSRVEPVPFIVRMHTKEAYLDSFQTFPDTFNSINLSSLQGHPVIHAVTGQGPKKRLEHFLVDDEGKFTQRETVFRAENLDHWFSVPLSSGTIVSSSSASDFVRLPAHVFGLRSTMHVISYTEPIKVPQKPVAKLEVTSTSCNGALASWSSSDDDFYTLLVSEDTIPDYLPQDGLNYNFSPNYLLANRVGQATRILYQGTDTSVQLSSLVAGRKYYFHMITGNGPAGATVYDISAYSSTSYTIAKSVFHDVLVISPERDTSFCEGDTIAFTASGANNFTWHNGVVSAKIEVTDKQSPYFLSHLFDGCVVSSDTIKANAVVRPVLSDLFTRTDAPFCPGDTVAITGRSNLGWGYRWSTGDTVPTIAVTQPGIYILTSVNRSCTDEKSIEINYSSYPVFGFEQDTFHVQYDSLLAFNITTDARTWKWKYLEEEGVSAAFNLRAKSTAYVRVEGFIDSGCISMDSAYLQVYRPDSLLIPNAFTPDGDGLNDVWSISAFYGAEYDVEVYDRWGALVYLADHESKGWDGTRNGYPMPIGAYYFIVKQKGKDPVTSGCLYLLH